MAVLRCVLLLFTYTLALYTSAADGALQLFHQNHQSHHRHVSVHHHRPPVPSSTSPRHSDHASHYAHSRHSHEPQRRELVPHRDQFPALTTSSSTTTTSPAADQLLSYWSARKTSSWNEEEQDGQLTVNPRLSDYNGFHLGKSVRSRSSEDTSSDDFMKTPQWWQNFTAMISKICCHRPVWIKQSDCPCNEPTTPAMCLLPCQNGGVCRSPGRCVCPKGFTGTFCQLDVDECVTEKPCDQICRNIIGGYKCYCRSGYELQANRQSCRKNDSDGTALEARDLENDFEEPTTSTTRRSLFRDTENEVDDIDQTNNYKELLQRLVKLEKQIAKDKNKEAETNEITSRIASAIDSINEIKRGIQNEQSIQQEVYDLRKKLELYEYETRKIQHLTNRVNDLEIRLRLQCRSSVYK